MENKCQYYTEKVFQLYKKYGIKSITMDEVARQLGISKKTLYQHFKDKADLVEQTMMFTIQNYFSKISNLLKEDLNAIEELLTINNFLNNVIEKEHNPAIDFDLKKYYPEIFEKFHKFRRDVTYKTLSKNLNKGQEEGLYRKDFNVEIIASVHMARMESHMQSESLVLAKYSHKEIFNEIFIYHIRGICSAKGIEFYEKKLKEQIENKKREI